jgi:hypothetical protein
MKRQCLGSRDRAEGALGDKSECVLRMWKFWSNRRGRVNPLLGADEHQAGTAKTHLQTHV